MRTEISYSYSNFGNAVNKIIQGADNYLVEDLCDFINVYRHLGFFGSKNGNLKLYMYPMLEISKLLSKTHLCS